MNASSLQQHIRQFLVHSFLYYQLGESVISDTRYDQICKSLQADLSLADDEEFPFKEIVAQALGQEGSGFSIRHYPPSIISAALHLLYQSQYAEVYEFSEFLERFGCRYSFDPL